MSSYIHIHGVSVGEVNSIKPLIHQLRAAMPQHSILLTCWTETAMSLARGLYNNDAGIIVDRLPFDQPFNHHRFLKRYDIQFSLWVDSEIWPGWLWALRRRGCPCMIINGRMSQKSYARWAFVPWLAQRILSMYARIDAQSPHDALRFTNLGGRAQVQPVNLKYLADPAPCDPEALALYQPPLARRRVILFAATHAGDEDRAMHVHCSLKRDFADLLTIIVPRHAHRAAALADLARAKGHKVQLRSENQAIANDTGIFYGDTMGEMALYYQLAPIAIMGKSFDSDLPGGQSPIEAAQAGCAILCGPHMSNFPGIMDDFMTHGAITIERDEHDVIARLGIWLREPYMIKHFGTKAQALSRQKQALGPDYMDEVTRYVENHAFKPQTTV